MSQQAKREECIPNKNERPRKQMEKNWINLPLLNLPHEIWWNFWDVYEAVMLLPTKQQSATYHCVMHFLKKTSDKW